MTSSRQSGRVPQAVCQTRAGLGRVGAVKGKLPGKSGSIHLYSMLAICSRIRSSSFFNSITCCEMVRSLALLPMV